MITCFRPMLPSQRIRSRPIRGLAATVAALLLFFAMGLVVAFANRNFLFEQRTSANQYRSTKAFEAAEAGLEWAIAQLNSKERISAACSGGALTDNAFKERYLSVNTSTGAITAGALRPVCVIPSAGGNYTCSCPTSGLASTSSIEGSAFKVEFETHSTAGIVRVYSYGCTSQAGDCHPGGAGSPDATAKITALLGVIPAVGTAPAAAITAKTNVTWSGAASAFGAFNTDVESNGVTIDAGGTIDSSRARLTTIPGSPPSSSLIPNDTSLSSITTDQMFATFFGMSKDEFRALAVNVTCPSNCSSTMETAVSNACDTCRLFWVEGDMDINGNTVLGTTTNPVVVVVNGAVHINGTMDIVGLLYSASSSWDNTGGGSAFLRGAAVSEGSFTGNGTPDFYFDSSVLKRLAKTPGSFIKIPGSWKDF